MRKFLSLITCFIVAGIFVFFSFVQAMTSTNYQVNWDSINSGGEDTGTSTNYHLRDTIGEQATGYTTSTQFLLSAGYRTGDEDLTTLTFKVGTQENDTGVSYSQFENVGKKVTVSATSSFAVGNLIGVVENIGLSQLVAIGKITDISGDVMTVDKWDGVPSSLSLNPAGGDDYVYRLEGFNAAFGTLSNTTGKTSLTGISVTSNAKNGYSVYVNSDGHLRTVDADYIDVSDGAVTVGSEEYGWQPYGSNATSTGSDHAFTTSTQEMQYSTSTTSMDERVGVVYKISSTVVTPAGDYSQKVYYTLTANY